MTIESHLPGTRQESSPQDSPETPGQVLDRDALLKLVDHDRDLLRELVDLFLVDSPALMSEIQAGVAEGDAARLEMAAHTLKSSVGNFGAMRAFELARWLESMGRDNKLAGAQEIYTALKQEMARVSTVLAEIAREGP